MVNMTHSKYVLIGDGNLIGPGQSSKIAKFVKKGLLIICQKGRQHTPTDQIVLIPTMVMMWINKCRQKIDGPITATECCQRKPRSTIPQTSIIILLAWEMS